MNFLSLKGGEGAAAAPEGVVIKRAIFARAIQNVVQFRQKQNS